MTYVLLQYGDDAFNHYYMDQENRRAFSIGEIDHNMPANCIVKLSREPAWSQLHPTIMGPDKSFFYFGPEKSHGHIAYGHNRQSVQMQYFRVQKREGSPSRYFKSQAGKDYKWRISQRKLECMDGRTCIAVWEISRAGDAHSASLTIKSSGLPIITEILTTLTLNRMASELGW